MADCHGSEEGQSAIATGQRHLRSKVAMLDFSEADLNDPPDQARVGSGPGRVVETALAISACRRNPKCKRPGDIISSSV
jgi:hypothetical protein